MMNFPQQSSSREVANPPAPQSPRQNNLDHPAPAPAPASPSGPSSAAPAQQPVQRRQSPGKHGQSNFKKTFPFFICTFTGADIEEENPNEEGNSSMIKSR